MEPGPTDPAASAAPDPSSTQPADISDVTVSIDPATAGQSAPSDDTASSSATGDSSFVMPADPQPEPELDNLDEFMEEPKADEPKPEEKPAKTDSGFSTPLSSASLPDLDFKFDDQASAAIDASFPEDTKQQVQGMLQRDIDAEEAQIAKMEEELSNADQALKKGRESLEKERQGLDEYEKKIEEQQKKIDQMHDELQGRRAKLTKVINDL